MKHYQSSFFNSISSYFCCFYRNSDRHLSSGEITAVTLFEFLQWSIANLFLTCISSILFLLHSITNSEIVSEIKDKLQIRPELASSYLSVSLRWLDYEIICLSSGSYFPLVFWTGVGFISCSLFMIEFLVSFKVYFNSIRLPSLPKLRNFNYYLFIFLK